MLQFITKKVVKDEKSVVSVKNEKLLFFFEYQDIITKNIK